MSHKDACSLPYFLSYKYIYMDQIIKNANAELEKLYELMLADNQSLIDQNDEELQKHISRLNSSWKEYNMKIIIKKRETMVIRTPKESKIYIL